MLTRVRGELVTLDSPFTMFNLSRTGFAVMSPVKFDVQAPLDFRFVATDGLTVRVTAVAVHSRPVPKQPGQYFTGFEFVPGGLMGRVPYALIDRLIEAVVPVGALL